LVVFSSLDAATQEVLGSLVIPRDPVLGRVVEEAKEALRELEEWRVRVEARRDLAVRVVVDRAWQVRRNRVLRAIRRRWVLDNV
jgi:urease accessory protein UreH